MKKLIQEIIEILEYFEEGLADVKEGSGEEQPMHDRIKEVLAKLKKLR